MKPLATFQIADTTAEFRIDEPSGRVGLVLVPSAMVGQRVRKRDVLNGLPEIDALPGNAPVRASELDPLVHLKLVGDPYSGAFAQGRTMRNAPSIQRFRYHEQTVHRDAGRTVVCTVLASPDGLRIEHRLAWHTDDPAMEASCLLHNGSDRPITLEMLSSFSLGGITPFHAADAPLRLRVHRFRSAWSAEGRPDTRSIEELHLERSWSGAGAFSERFGQIGSMPVRGWFPFVAIEDIVAGVCWGANLAWAGSWQIEIFRQHDDVCISGGLADREFGHWTKSLAPGETLATPAATLACVRGDPDELCDRLTAAQHHAVDRQPAVEQDLPIVFNEWCTTWGDPSHEKIVAIAERLKGCDVRYLVIDAGWYKPDDGGNWDTAHGDWTPSKTLFPDGLKATADAIRRRGLIPGLWFEMETVGENARAFTTMADHLLHRDGLPIMVRSRRFWDLNDAAAVEYLSARVIDLLERCGFGYLKVDYNETIGIGSDGPDSLGEGLRRQVLGIYHFFERIRARLPELVIENCSSGGHRLEPSMMSRTAMSSFSDAHETVEIPIIAANLHRLMLPRQEQIWSVLHASDSDRRLAYSLAATFLGRMCLSGEIAELSDAQWELVRAAMSLYRKAAPILKRGMSRRFGETGPSWRHPRGWQGVVRTSEDGSAALVVVHAFAETPQRVEVSLPPGRTWSVTGGFPIAGAGNAEIAGSILRCPIEGPFSARVILLRG